MAGEHRVVDKTFGRATPPACGPVYTGVMTENAPERATIHDRSPVMLAPDDWLSWLTAPLEDLYRFDRPWPASDISVEHTDVLWKHGGQAAASQL